ncbi:hypothetical protein [Actinomadura sp. KC345]|nr:hypothetical protein [Actinomadura sp. KC345]
MAMEMSHDRNRSGCRSPPSPPSARSTDSWTTSSTSAWPPSAQPTTL